MIEVSGNLIKLAIEGNFDYILHGCNCFNNMGSGIARQIALAFPVAYKADLRTKKGSPDKLGNYTTALVRKPSVFTVVNIYSQYTGGPDFKPSALKVALFKLNKVLPRNARIGMPLIGCGVGGGTWEEVQRIISNEFRQRDVTIVHYKE